VRHSHHGHRVVLHEKGVAAGIADVASRIVSLSGDATIVPVVVMDGGGPFGRSLIYEMGLVADIDRRINITVKSYDGQKQKAPTVTMLSEDRIHLSGAGQSRDKQIVIIDDIIETGNTIAAILEHEWIALEVTARPILLASLLTKSPSCSDPLQMRLSDRDRTTKGLKHISAYDLPSRLWVYGFGMDLDGKHRDLPFIAEKS
jgi:hypoxanthine-guanine phosphoribosyltransferase